MVALTGEPCKELGDMTDEEYRWVRENFGSAILCMPSVMLAVVKDLRIKRSAEVAVAAEMSPWRADSTVS